MKTCGAALIRHSSLEISLWSTCLPCVIIGAHHWETTMAKVTKGKELAVLAPNRIGLLEEISSALAEARINILSISGYILEDDQASLLMMVDKHAAAKKVLNKLSGFRVAEDSVVCLELPNKPGEMAKVAAKIRGAGIDINY